jgi:hypothetical protein
MSSKQILHAYQLAEARGTIPEGHVNRLAVATVLAAGVTAFHRAYFGDKEWGKAVEDSRVAKHESHELAMGLVENVLLSDVKPILRQLGAVQTTTDFPLALAQIRERVRRGSYNPVESSFWQVATRRTAQDFKKLRGVRTDPFNRLPKRPEGTDVEYADFGSTEDGYQVANYELAVALTWEAWINDDISEFVTALANLGVAGRRTRGLVMFEALKAITRTTPSGANDEGTAAAGGPTRANLVWAYQTLADQTNADGKPIPRLLTDIAVPAKWTITGRQALNSEFTVLAGGSGKSRESQNNAAFGLAQMNVEAMMAEVTAGTSTATDWLAYDRTQQFMEFAALRGYEGGPRTFTKMPDVVETDMEGSFDNKSIAVKVSDNVGAKVVDEKSVLLVAGQ